MKRLLALTLLLLSSISAFSTERAPQVFLSHFYVTLDQATYEAIKSAPQIAALANIEEKHTVAGGQSWTGFYLHGRQTYMEFFGDAALADDMRLGDCGIGLAVEAPGGAASVAAHLRTAFGDKVVIEKQVRTTANGDVSWYLATHVSAEGPQALEMWVMEVDSGYLSALHPGSPVRNPLSREQYNSWDFRPEQQLDNVVGLTVALSKEKASELATELRLLGWTIHRKATGLLAIGPDVKIRVIPADQHTGIRQVELRLLRSVPSRTIQLGNSELRLAGKSGQLVFLQP